MRYICRNALEYLTATTIANSKIIYKERFAHMEFTNEIDPSVRSFTTRLIIERALARGWDVTGFKSNLAILLITPTGSTKPVKIFSSTPPQTSFSAAKIAKDKYVTNRILNHVGIPVPDERIIKSVEEINDEIKSFIKQYQSVVFKPLDASHGNGVVVNIDSIERLIEVFNEQKIQNKSRRYIIQEQLSGHDIRILCIDNKFVNSISREPASVIGDGIHTVEQLIAMVNRQEDRSTNYSTSFNVIPMQVVLQYLSATDIKKVPSLGELVIVVGISNVGVGGTRKNIKPLIPDFLIQIAEEVAETLELPVCGVDFMVSQLPTREMSYQDLNPKVIEVNQCPMLTMYEDLHSIEQYEVIDAYLDLLIVK